MKRAIKTVVMALVGAMIGYIVGQFSLFETDVRFWVWFCMGVLAGWIFLGKYVGSLVSANIALMVFLLIVRFMLAGIIGWVLIPIEIIHGLIDVLSDNREE